MTEREKLYIEELQSKVAKYEDFLNEALEGPFKVGTVVAGPNSSLYLVKSADSNVIIPANIIDITPISILFFFIYVYLSVKRFSCSQGSSNRAIP